MKHIMIVEDDPVVLLDVNEALLTSLPASLIACVSLDEGMSQLHAKHDLADTALISAVVPENPEALHILAERGLCVILTNRLSPERAKKLPTVIVIDRPFDAATLITHLSEFQSSRQRPA